MGEAVRVAWHYQPPVEHKPRLKWRQLPDQLLRIVQAVLRRLWQVYVCCHQPPDNRRTCDHQQIK